MRVDEPRAMREVHEWRAKLQLEMEGMAPEEQRAYIKARAAHLMRRVGEAQTPAGTTPQPAAR